MTLLALALSSEGSTGGLTLPLLYSVAIGEMLAGTSSREASTSSMLAWDEVLMGQSETSNFWHGDAMTATVVIFPREECLDSQLDASIIALPRRSLTSAAILPSDFGGDLCGLVVWMMEASSIGSALVSDSSMGGMSISK